MFGYFFIASVCVCVCMFVHLPLCLLASSFACLHLRSLRMYVFFLHVCAFFNVCNVMFNVLYVCNVWMLGH